MSVERNWSLVGGNLNNCSVEHKGDVVLWLYVIEAQTTVVVAVSHYEIVCMYNRNYYDAALNFHTILTHLSNT